MSCLDHKKYLKVDGLTFACLIYHFYDFYIDDSKLLRPNILKSS